MLWQSKCIVFDAALGIHGFARLMHELQCFQQGGARFSTVPGCMTGTIFDWLLNSSTASNVIQLKARYIWFTSTPAHGRSASNPSQKRVKLAEYVGYCGRLCMSATR